MSAEKKRVLWEQAALWLVTLLLIKAAVMLHGAGAPEVVLAAVPLLFMYMPVAACKLRGVDDSQYPLALPFRELAPWIRGLKLNLAVIGLIAVPFVVLYHFWQTRVFGFSYRGTWPEQPLMLIGYHLFFVAIPEEMFYRGYMQARLDEVWEPRWKVLGATIGPGLIVTCIVFAAGHSIVQPQWWHFAIFIPSLVFGWMRARTNDIIAGALFHAWCNITVAFLDTLYGIVPP